VVVGDDGRVLLARRAIDPGAGLWDLPGGFCEPDETPDVAAVRELREEAGVEIELTGFLGHIVDVYGPDDDRTLNAIYVGRITAGEPLPDDDVAELVWVEPDALPPAADVAFANTVEALRRWRATLDRSA
jgi:ADP-ribose pyrophosphatase YjhB (NUDIX family)